MRNEGTAHQFIWRRKFYKKKNRVISFYKILRHFLNCVPLPTFLIPHF